MSIAGSQAEDSLERLVDEALEGLKSRAHDNVKSKGILKKTLQEQFDYCFEQAFYFRKALQQNNAEKAWLRFVRVSIVADHSRIIDPGMVTEEYRQQAENLRIEADNMVKSMGKIRDMLADSLLTDTRNTRTRRKGRVLVRVAPKMMAVQLPAESIASDTNSIARKSQGPNQVDDCIENNSEVRMEMFRHMVIRGDGHCAFRAIVQGLSNGTLNNKAEAQNVRRLRKRVALTLNTNQELRTAVGLPIRELVELESGQDNFSKYVDSMQKRAYGGATEFMLLAKELNVRIVILMKKRGEEGEEGVLEILGQYGDFGRRVYLLWNQGKGEHAEANNHYDLLIPVA